MAFVVFDIQNLKMVNNLVYHEVDNSINIIKFMIKMLRVKASGELVFLMKSNLNN
jgi:DUF1680 family protein